MPEVKTTFRRLAVKYHPDRNPGNRLAEERFKEISGAYHILGDEESKREYDLRLSGLFASAATEQAGETESNKKRKHDWEELNRRRKKQEEYKIIHEWDQLQEGTPIPVRRAFNYGLVLSGSVILFRNWFFTIETFSPLSFLAAVALIFIGNILDVNLDYTRYLYLKLKGKIRFNLYNRLLRKFLIGLFLGFGSGIVGAHLMALYHFKHYSVVTEAVIRFENNVFRYEYEVNGKKYKKNLPERHQLNNIQDGRVRVRYSSVNPVFSKIMEE